MGEPVKPYADNDAKKAQVARMFDNIAGNYDFLNHFFSLGIDKIWRKKALKMLDPKKHRVILDVATGTGDFALQAMKNGLQPSRIFGVDISEGMLEVGRKKVKKAGYENIIELKHGDSENLPFESDTFDAYVAGFGVRNFQDLDAGLREMYRVLKPGGKGIILEFSRPHRFPFKQAFGFYFKRIMPAVGKRISKDPRAYAYLPESVDAFPEGQEFLRIMQRCAYSDCGMKRLSGGIATIYWGHK